MRTVTVTLRPQTLRALFFALSSTGFACVGLACAKQPAGVPAGKLAVVGDVEIGREDLAELMPQLGAYARYRFAGPEGEAALLNAVIDAELLSQAAAEAGFSQDPRISFALREELAARYWDAQLERELAARPFDEGLLRALYQQHLQEFAEPEQRGARGVLYGNYAEAEAAQARLLTEPLERLGEVVTTQTSPRDDGEYPGFHPALFSADGVSGARLPYPVVVGEKLLVGVVDSVVPARVRPFEDPSVQSRLQELALASERSRRYAE